MPKPALRENSVSAAGRDAAERGRRRDAVLFTTDFRPHVGGIAESLAGLWREASAWGNASVHSTISGAEAHGVRMLPPPPDRRLGQRFGDGVAPLRRVNTLAHFAALRRYARRTLGPVLDQLDEQSRVCIGLWSPLAHFWCDALAAAGRPYALFAYGLDIVQPLYGTVAPWRIADFRRAARIIPCSTATGAIAVERLGVDPNRVRVVHPGIEMTGYVAPSGEEIAAVLESLHLTGDQLLLSVGRLVRRKGFDVALRAFAAYRARHHRGEYVIAGEGPERRALEALARELGVQGHVRFAGAVDERTKLSLYEACDVFVMPNSLLDNVDWEGFGIVFLEAARAGKPSIGGANGGVADAIENGVSGLLVNPSDLPGVSAALDRLLADDAYRARLGAAARQRAAAQFDWPVIGARFRSVLEEVW